MNEYVCFYNGKRWECYASSMFAAKEKAVAYFKPPKSKQHMVRAVLAKWAAPQPEHDLKDVPCECCGYMTYHREHMGCIRAAAPKAAPGVGNSGFDHQSAADFLSGKTVTADTVRALLATGGQGQAVEKLREELAEETEAASNWRRLALQFDGHRMTALGHLKAILHPDSSVDEYKAAELFLKAPPLDGESVLAQRITELSTAPQQADARDALTPAARDVLAERARQVSVEGWTPERDDQYTDCQLAAAAASYAVCGKDPKALKLMGVTAWPWRGYWWKPETYRRNLEKAGALILAEIERIDRHDGRTG